MTRKRVVIAGLGDTGVLTAIHLGGSADVVGISVKPGLVSGQELGTRLSCPARWARDYWVPFDRYRGLDRVRTVHGEITGVDLDAHTVSVRTGEGAAMREPYDALVISTGVTNGFWRIPTLQSAEDVDTNLRLVHERLATAASIIVIGGGAAAVSAAVNLATTWPQIRVDLYYPGERALPQHHWKTWQRIERRLVGLHVGLHPNHRAVVPAGFDCDRITDEPVRWSTGQSSASADAVVWAIGRVRPNTDWVPPELLDDNGFVLVTPELRAPDRPEVFAIGDVAATDPLRNSARGRADGLLAHNIEAYFAGRRLRSYRPRTKRWGSVLGVLPDGFEIFTPGGSSFTLPSWSIDSVLQPWIVRRGIYRGIRPPRRT